MADASAIPHLQGLEIEAVEWLPSGADSGLVRVRGRWSVPATAQPGLPELLLRAGGADHRFESLPDARFARDPASWRGSYLVPVALVAAAPDALWVEWPGGVRSGLPAPAHGLASPPQPAPEPPAEEPGGQVIDRAVLAERRARRAEAAEQAQARVAAEALRAVEALELQSAELERRLAEASAERDALAEGLAPAEPALRGGAIAASAARAERPEPSAEELERLAERRQAALASALDSLARLRAQSREWRLGLRTGEIARSGDAVRLAVLEAERALGEAGPRGALKARTHELAGERARVAELETVRAALEAELESARGEAEAAHAELERAREEADGRLAAALAAAEATREQLERRHRGEHAVYAEVRQELRDRLEATVSRANALEAAQAELAADRDGAAGRAESLAARTAALETALAIAETGVATAEATAANAEARLRVESVARAALEAELDRASEGGAAYGAVIAERDELAAALAAERLARQAERDALVVERDQHASGFADSLAAELEAARAAGAAVEAELAAARASNSALREELEAARAERGSLAADLEAERSARASAEAALADAFAAAAQQGATLQDRIAELERGAAGRADEDRLAEAARAHAEAAAASTAPPAETSGRMLADLDAAAAALRDAAPAPESAPSVDSLPPEESEATLEAPPAERVRPTIVSASGPPPRIDIVGRSARDYPRLRGAIVKLAHDDPAAAGLLLAALLPAQAAALAAPLDYDITIAEAGTFAVKLDARGARVHARPEPRGRPHADFHLSADALTFAELLAGVDHRIGRWRGPARFSGSRRKLDVLRALPATSISLSEAARAGAALEPSLVYRTLSYAVHPSWTRGERFTLAQEITGERPETWYLSARDGAGMTVSASPPEEGVEATVSMARKTFGLMLRGEDVPSGARPTVRGELRVVDLVRAWMDRAQRGG